MTTELIYGKKALQTKYFDYLWLKIQNKWKQSKRSTWIIWLTLTSIKLLMCYYFCVSGPRDIFRGENAKAPRKRWQESWALCGRGILSSMKARMQLLALTGAPRGCHSSARLGRGAPQSARCCAGPNRAHCPCQTMKRVYSCPGMVGERLQPADRNRNMGGA